MINFRQVITDANTEYIYSTDVDALDGALASVEQLLTVPALNDNNRANAEALLMRLGCKIFALLCVTRFDIGIQNKLDAFVAANMQTAVDKGYVKSVAVMENTTALVGEFCACLTKKAEITAQCQSEQTLVSSGKKLIAEARSLVERMNNIDFTAAFGDGVAFVDGAVTSEQLSSWAAGVRGAYATALERTVKVKRPDYRKYRYFPAREYDEGDKANTLILNTPFVDEARLYAINVVEKDADFCEFDIGEMGGSKSDIDKIFGYAEYKNCAVFVSNAQMIASDNVVYFLRAAISYGKSCGKVFISDTRLSLYDAAMTAAAAGEINALDVSAAYITMPLFNATVEELASLKTATDEECRAALKTMPFLGFMGLNDIVRPEHAGDWAARGKKISQQNSDSAFKYLAKLKSPMLFIDGGWGNFTSGAAVGEVDGEFDYDGIPDIDLANIRRIVQSDATVFGKCGMIARYCTTGTGDMTVWGMLDRDRMLNRIELAVKLVCRVLCVDICPQVVFADRLGGGAGAQCCDGGKLIKFKYSTAKDVDWLRDAIVHECFHALQNKLINGDWTEWYYTNMGISYGRVCLWKETKQYKYDGDTQSDIYSVHMYEADARAFEKDCDRDRNAYWSTVDFD